MFKWYYYHFLKFLHTLDWEKYLLALASRASDPWIALLFGIAQPINIDLNKKSFSKQKTFQTFIKSSNIKNFFGVPNGDWNLGLPE